jgi:hypothetical protein
MSHLVKILEVRDITHDVKSFKIERPVGYNFTPGQATEVSINKKGLENEKRPFTFTSTNEDSHLEFIIKIYKQNNGVTKELGRLKKGDELIIGDVWGAIEYKGPGYFIAGGAGITPFIAILRQLKMDQKIGENRLFFANKTSKDIILSRELVEVLGKNVIFTLTEEEKEGYDDRYIDERFLVKEVKDFNKPFYICGPPKMTEDITSILIKHGASPDHVVFEK